jgi:hypothetical protein
VVVIVSGIAVAAVGALRTDRAGQAVRQKLTNPDPQAATHDESFQRCRVRYAGEQECSYVWDSRDSYVNGTRHRDEYQLFMTRDLATLASPLTVT